MFLFFINIAVILLSYVGVEYLAKDKDRNYKTKLYLTLSIGYLLFLAVFRSTSVGTDTQRYCRIFSKIASQDNIFEYMSKVNLEAGYVLYNFLLSKISTSPRILLVVSNTFMFYSVGRFFYKYSKESWMSVFLFFTIMLFDFFLSGLRQGLAIAILLFAYDALLENKNIRFIILVIVATLFHTSAIIFLFVYLVKNIQSTKKFLIVLYTSALLIFALWPLALKVFLMIFPKYSYYVGDAAFSSNGVLGIIYKLVLYVGLLFIGEYFKDKMELEERSTEDQFAFRMVAILPAIAIVSMNASVFTRFFRYFECFICVYFPNIILRKQDKIKKYLLPVFLIGMIFYAFIIQILRTPEWQQTYPYSFMGSENQEVEEKEDELEESLVVTNDFEEFVVRVENKECL